VVGRWPPDIVGRCKLIAYMTELGQWLKNPSLENVFKNFYRFDVLSSDCED
jgi:hypothetical protein